MNQEALDKLLKDLKDDGTLIVDGTSVSTMPATKAKVHKLPLTEIAQKAFGEAMYANMVMLGAFTKITRLVSEQSMEKTIRENVPAQTVEKNVDAFRKGLQL
jgi:2-oxoglutarate ferredoxin oxidoreductase subunit gamma